tara:strand:- start:61 stop:711 length:651 start_codon:yes stop_codon:yes gene_type:complete
MANYIKVPLAVNPPRSFAAAITIAGSRLSGGGTIASGTASPATATTVVPAGGTGATFTGVATGTAIANMTLTIANAGEGYKVGDVVTVAAQSTGGQTTWNAPITFTITKADLIESDGTVTNEYVLIDIDKVLCVDPYANGINFYQNIPSLNTTQNPPERPQQLKLKLDHPSINPELDMAARDVADAMVKAIQTPNSVPVVVWSDPDIEALTLEQSA